MSFNLPNSYLLGVLLVASTHSGPQLVYNYPPILSHELANKANTAKLMIDSDSSEDEIADEGDGYGNREDEYIFDNESDGEEPQILNDNEEKWNTRNLNYYMGTKKDLLSFLDEQERHRETKTPNAGLVLKNGRDDIPLEKTMSIKSDKSLLSKVKSIDNTLHSGASGPFQLGAPAIPTNSQLSASHNLLAPGGSLRGASGSSYASPITSPSSIPPNNSPSGKSAGVGVNTNTIFGMEPDYLCDTLCPPKQMCNSRFEILIDDLVFLGLPVHCYDNGTWRKKKSRKVVSKKSSGMMREDRGNGEKGPRTGDGGVDAGVDAGVEGHSAAADSGSNIGTGAGSSEVAESSSSKSTMNMFHLVFIMNPPIIETNYRIDEMFHYVISRLSLVLRYEQLKNDYVWQQIKLIQKFKEEFRISSGDNGNNLELSLYLLQRSSLCKMMSDCFNSIAKSEIANLSINNKLRSFQIPIKTEFHSLPERTVPYLPGSHLSSTVNLLSKTGLINVGDTTRYGLNDIMNMVMMSGGAAADLTGGSGGFGTSGRVDEDDDGLDDDESDSVEDIIYFALLLLDDPESIISDIKTEQNSTLANFIRLIRPTESLYKLSQKLEQTGSSSSSSRLSITEIKSFAFHLIYWRRARVIPPLNSRSVYIVSPMAPVTLNLYYDIQTFSQQFTRLPSLPHFLKLLSSTSRKPKQYATIIPSRDHREIYLDALGWLIRYGYVTQLHTFIWLKISRKIKMKVEEDLENESSSKKRAGSKQRNSMDNSSKTANLTTANTSIKSGGAVPTSDNSSKKTGPKLHPALLFDTQEIGSNLAPNIVLEEDDDTIILDPDRATTLERRWISKIVTHECNLSTELTAVFYKLLKYMNGKNSLELLLLKEDVSRNDLRKLLYAIEDHIISVRHW